MNNIYINNKQTQKINNCGNFKIESTLSTEFKYIDIFTQRK